MNQMKAFMKRHIAALLVLLLVAVSIPVGVTWAKYASSQNVTSGSGLELKATAANQFTIDKSKMWAGLTGLSTRPTAIKLCQGKDLPDGVTRQAYIEDSSLSNGQIGLYTSADGETVYIAPIGNKTAKMYTQKDCSAMFQYNKIGYSDETVSRLTAIDGLSNLITDNATNMGSMFGGCSAVKTLDVSGFNTSNVTDMGYMFQKCKAVQALDVSKFNTSSVTNMSAMFLSCHAVTMLDVSKFDTAKVTDMSSMFAGCKVTTIDLSNFNTSEVTDMSRMFQNCAKLTTLDVSAFNTSKVESMNGMFDGCEALRSLDLSTFDTKNVWAMATMFQWCKSLQTLDVSNFDTTQVNSFSAMFNWCSNLTELDLSSFKVSEDLRSIENMFWGCMELKKIYVNEAFDLTKIGRDDNAFFNCTNLVGGAGTKYDKNIIGRTYAHIDGGTANPGYFTAKTASNAADLTKTVTVDLNGLSNIDAAPVN